MQPAARTCRLLRYGAGVPSAVWRNSGTAWAAAPLIRQLTAHTRASILLHCCSLR